MPRSTLSSSFFFQAEDGIRDRNVTGFRRVLFRSSCELVLISSRISFPDFGANRSATEAPTTLPISEPNKKSFVLNSLLFDIIYLLHYYFFLLINFKAAVPLLTALVAFSTSSVDVFEILDDKVLID